MKKRRILVYGANPQSFKNVELVAEKLRLKEWEVDHLDLSSFFHQQIPNLRASQEKLNLNWALSKPFYQFNALQKLWIVCKLALILFSRTKRVYDKILVGDVGIIEYFIFKLWIKGPVYFIQDAILLWPETTSKFKRLRSVLYFGNRLNICSKIYCSGEVTKQTHIQDGADMRIICSFGIPRFQQLDLQSFTEFKTRKFTFIGEAYSWHGHQKLHDEQLRFLKNIDQHNDGLINGSRLYFRRHPRDVDEYVFENITVVQPEEESLHESLVNTSFIMSFGYPSTVIFEAGFYSVSTIFLKADWIEYGHMTFYEEFEELVQVRSLSNLLNECEIKSSKIDFSKLKKFISFPNNSTEVILRDIVDNKG